MANHPDRIIIDDPGYHPEQVDVFWREALANRAGGPAVIIMSRQHEADIPGDVLLETGAYPHLVIPYNA
jgi:hypothetical protein